MEKKQIECPMCGKRGGVRGRKDAYADHKIFVNDEDNTTLWKYESTAIMDDVQAYECFLCDKELEKRELEDHNDVIL